MKKLEYLKHNAMALILVCVSLLSPFPVYGQLVGTDTAPGAACTAKGAIRITANSTGLGAYILTCDADDGQWVATINTNFPTANEHVANKQYVDNVVGRTILPCTDNLTALCLLDANRFAADSDFSASHIAESVTILGVKGTLVGSGCATTIIGDSCPDGTVYVGFHPALHVPLYIPPTDQGNLAWRISGTDAGPTSYDDGRVNSALIPNEARFPAFKACKDLRLGGYSDWYLPSNGELLYLWWVSSQIEAKGNITNFQGDYWSSTHHDADLANFRNLTINSGAATNKGATRGVRCVRR